MATYYLIHSWRNGTELWTHALYETFEEACDRVEEAMDGYPGFEQTEFEKNKPNRDELKKKIEDDLFICYYQISSELEFHIRKMFVAPRSLPTTTFINL